MIEKTVYSFSEKELKDFERVIRAEFIRGIEGLTKDVEANNIKGLVIKYGDFKRKVKELND